MSGNIKVVVRCRPLNAREIARGAVPLIRMEGNQTLIRKPNEDTYKPFTFDKSYWSADKNDEHYANQELVYNDMGRELLDHAFDGYNCCIFAYGQTGSGKSYSMMGYGEDKGIIPRTCVELFERISYLSSDTLKFQVEVSYIEIYNEKVRDLLNPANKGNLKVREHPTIGPYVEDLSRLVVNSFEDIDRLMTEGNKARTVAATQMNETSSRSHAVFTLFLTSKKQDETVNQSTEKASRISLVDLAGSERANSTGATGVRLKEGANINKSLTTLGKVIAALASDTKPTKSAGSNFIPYRDSVLTWLLKDSLGGNSKTAMMAAISPADYDETLSTLRYADQAKRIRNKAVVNEDPNARLIRELKQELQALRDTLMIYAPEEVEKIQKKGSNKLSRASPMLLVSPESPLAKKSGGTSHLLTKDQVVDQLEASEKLLFQVNQTWEEKMMQTQEIHREREKALEDMGVMVEKDNMGVYAPTSIHLINLNEDPLMSECLMYHIKPGITKVGRLESSKADIKLSGGPEIKDEHCFFENRAPSLEKAPAIVTIHPLPDAVTLVNGRRIVEPKVLQSGYRIIFGSGLQHLFRFNHPDQVRQERQNQVDELPRRHRQASSAFDEPDDCLLEDGIDWDFAHAEALRIFGGPQATHLNIMTDEDLQYLSEGITKVREFRNRKRISSDTQNLLYRDLSEDPTSPISPRTSFSSTSHKRLSTLSSVPTLITDLDDNESQTSRHITQDEADHLIRLATEEIQLQLELQRQSYEQKIQQIESSSLKPDPLEQAQPLIRKVIDQWRSLRYVKMAETCLIHAVLLKEANIMARELGKHVVYQWIVVHDNISASPSSFWETRQHDPDLLKEPKPCVAVQVIDHVHHVHYLWSIKRLQQRVRQMRHIYDYSDRPLFPTRPLRDDPFYDTPTYTLIGLARVPLRNLTVQLHADNCVDVYCRNTGQVMGQIRVLVTPIARSVSRRPVSGQMGEKYLLHIGQQQVFEIRIQELKGICECDFSQVHAQFRLSSFGNVERFSSSDKVYQTDPVSHFGNRWIEFRQCQTLSVHITERMMDVILNEGLTIEVYGKAQESYLLGLVEEEGGHGEGHHARTQSAFIRTLNKKASVEREALLEDRFSIGRDFPASRRLSLERRFTLEQQTFDGILMEERHDILAWVQIYELNSDGEYAAVQVHHTESQHPDHPHMKEYGDVFCLRQGYQRRIAITLTHDSGKQFEWNEIQKVEIGQARLMDSKGQEIERSDHSPVNVHLFPDLKSISFSRNGIARITVQGSWDSSLHECLFLNRLTSIGQHIRLMLSWEVISDKCTAPIPFELDIRVQMGGKINTMTTSPSTSSSVFRQFLMGNSITDSTGTIVQKVVNKASSIFILKLKPPMTRKVKELWRLNTANKYVRGEEFIGTWKARGVSLITDYREARKLMLFRESVAAFRHSLVLIGHPQTKIIQNRQSNPQLSKEFIEEEKKNSNKLIKKIIKLWTSKFGTQEEIMISQDPPDISLLSESLSINSINKYNKKIMTKIKLSAEIQNIYPSDTITKKGYLLHPENVDETWFKHWFVLRRPFIIIYKDQLENEMIGILNLNSARVDYKSDIEEMLQKKNIFAIYTNNNAYLFQAHDFEEMKDWISKIDQFYPMKVFNKS